MQFKGKVRAQYIRQLLLEQEEIYRDDGSKVQFDKNAVVLTDDKGDLLEQEYLVLSQRIKI